MINNAINSTFNIHVASTARNVRNLGQDVFAVLGKAFGANPHGIRAKVSANSAINSITVETFKKAEVPVGFNQRGEEIGLIQKALEHFFGKCPEPTNSQLVEFAQQTSKGTCPDCMNLDLIG